MHQLGIDVLETTAYDFANGEMYVRYTESVRGADVFVLQSHCTPVNKSIMEQLIMIDALKRASARSITAVCPLLGYSRQDKKHRGREPISCRLVFDLLRTAGADRVMSVDLHAAQTQGFFDTCGSSDCHAGIGRLYSRSFRWSSRQCHRRLARCRAHPCR